MEATCTSANQLPDTWKTEFARMRPLIPAVLLVLTAIAIIIVGCFGQAGIGIPWWSGSLILISGACFLTLVLMKQTFPWEKCAYIAMVISLVISMLAIVLYTLEFALATLPESPFPHHGLSTAELVIHYRIITVELALTGFEIGMMVWILLILQKTRKILAHHTQESKP